MFKLNIKNQQGAVTLLTSLMLVIATSLVVMSSGKTILQETKITANSSRTAQANTSANAAMDFAVLYFTTNFYGVLKSDGVTINPKIGGLDQWHTVDDKAGKDEIVDYPYDANIPSMTSCSMPSTSAYPITFGQLARFSFINTPEYDIGNGTEDNRCKSSASKLTADGKNMNAGIIIAEGWSDDCSAYRRLTQCVTVGNAKISVLKGDGPEQPFISQSGVDLKGTVDIINRYTNITVWSGEVVDGTGDMHTFTRSSDKTINDLIIEAEANGDLPYSLLNDEEENNNTEVTTNIKNAIGADVIFNDPFLKNQTSDELFNAFFRDDLDGIDGNAKQEIEDMADESQQRFTDVPDNLADLSGLIWIDPSGNITLADAGTPEKPVTIIVEGNDDVSLTGDIFGVVYIMGTLDLAGNAIITGSLISEKSGKTSGTPKVIFNPFAGAAGDGLDGLGGSTSAVTGTYSIVNGSWRDW